MLKIKEWLRSRKEPQFRVVQRTGNDSIYVVDRLMDEMRYVRDYTIKRFDQKPIMEAMRVKKFHEDLVHVDVTYYTRKSPVEENLKFDERHATIEINDIPGDYLPSRFYKEQQQIQNFVNNEKDKGVDSEQG